MQIDASHLWLHLFTSSDAAERALDRIYFSDNKAVVTDGNRLVLVPCATDDRTLSLPLSVAKAALRGSRKGDVWIAAEDGLWLKRERDGVAWPISPETYEHNPYPNYQRVLPESHADEATTSVFAVNASYLADIARYLKKTQGPEVIRVQSDSDGAAFSAVHITAPGLADVLFVVMPWRL